MDDVVEIVSVDQKAAVMSNAEVKQDNESDYRDSLVQLASEGDASVGSQIDVIELDGWSLKLSTKEKSLIERYKNLERLMKKKKMLGQVEEINKNQFSRINSEGDNSGVKPAKADVTE